MRSRAPVEREDVDVYFVDARLLILSFGAYINHNFYFIRRYGTGSWVINFRDVT